MVWSIAGIIIGLISAILSLLAYLKLRKSWITERGVIDVVIPVGATLRTFVIEGTGTFDFLSFSVIPYLKNIEFTIYADGKVVFSDNFERLINIGSDGIKRSDPTFGISYENKFEIKFSKILQLEISNRKGIGSTVAKLDGYYNYSLFK